MRRAQPGVRFASAGDEERLASGSSLHVPAGFLTVLVRAECDESFGSGAEGARTPDLLAASEALSQLSYSPKAEIAREV